MPELVNSGQNRRGGPAVGSERLVVGVDLGLDGALAAVDVEGRLVELCDTPTLEVEVRGKRRRRYAVALMARILGALAERAVLVVLEEVNAFAPAGRTMGASSALALGKGAGLWLGIAAACRLRVHEVVPAVWKRAMLPGLGPGKDSSRMLALRLFPDRAEDFARKRDHGRAEAALLAEYGRRIGRVAP